MWLLSCSMGRVGCSLVYEWSSLLNLSLWCNRKSTPCKPSSPWEGPQAILLPSNILCSRDMPLKHLSGASHLSYPLFREKRTKAQGCPPGPGTLKLGVATVGADICVFDYGSSPSTCSENQPTRMASHVPWERWTNSSSPNPSCKWKAVLLIPGVPFGWNSLTKDCSELFISGFPSF